LRRYFVNTKNGVEKSSSTPFSIDPISINAGPQQQKTRRGKCLLREKGYVIGEITALEVAVITYIKRGEG